VRKTEDGVHNGACINHETYEKEIIVGYSKEYQSGVGLLPITKKQKRVRYLHATKGKRDRLVF
jgi:hypothetical protein